MEKELNKLREEFLSIAHGNLAPDSEEIFLDVIDEARWQISDWYNGDSYYPKPEDILADYFLLSASDAHRFLPVFLEELK